MSESATGERFNASMRLAHALIQVGCSNSLFTFVQQYTKDMNDSPVLSVM